MTWRSLPLIALGCASASLAQDATNPEEQARSTPIIVEGQREEAERGAVLGSRIAREPRFTDLNVATSTGISGLTPGAGLEPFNGANPTRKRITSTCVSDNEAVGERASCLLLQARSLVDEGDVAGASDIYRVLVSSDEFGTTERLAGGTEFYNLADGLGDAGLREEALIRLVDSGALPPERQAGARRTLVAMALARGDKESAVARLEAHAAIGTPDAQSVANLAILSRELALPRTQETMARAIALRESEGGDVPQSWREFVALP